MFFSRIEIPSNAKDKTRRFSVQLTKVLNDNLVEDFDAHSTVFVTSRDAGALAFRYPNNDSTIIPRGGLSSLCITVFRAVTSFGS